MPGVTETGQAERGLEQHALSIDRLTYRYTGASEATLKNVSIDVLPGEFIVLAGRSGTGKTSLLRAACGLIPHFHGGEISGSAMVGGRDTRESGPGELADLVGYVAQDPETQIISTTVAAELDLPLRFRGDHPAERARAVEEVALALNIPHLLQRTITTLSGGEMQRVALAVALVTRPPLVLLDEPTSQLDPVAGDELIWLLRRLNEEWGVAVVLAEHRLERCLAAADRVVAMEDGSIRFDGGPREFLEYATGHDPALATPAARMFASAGIEPLPVGVRDARAVLRARGIKPGSQSEKAPVVKDEQTPKPRPAGKGLALNSKGLWVELDPGEGPIDVLRGIDLKIEPGERVALMGRNGAGKSTFLKSVAGLTDPVKGKVKAPGGIALLTQNPGDYLVRERVGDELPGDSGAAAMRAVGLEVSPDSDPRDLSGGERQRLALAIALAGRMEGEALPKLVALDEPTRGMDRALKDGLTELAIDLSRRGAAVLISTHDVEFAATFADRVVLLGDGELIADADTATVLSGGWYFATEVARVLDRPGIVSVAEGAAWLTSIDGTD
ncbi:MAG: ATP-binding cassette domain-containing protein [Solirubrobacterales bacterium]